MLLLYHLKFGGNTSSSSGIIASRLSVTGSSAAVEVLAKNLGSTFCKGFSVIRSSSSEGS